MSLTLRLTDGSGSEHVYTDDPPALGGGGLLAARRVVVEERTRDEIRLGSLALEVGTGAFLGASGRDALPEPSVEGLEAGGYRAALSGPSGLTIEGVVPRVEIARDTLPRTWSLALLSSSQEDMWARLEGVHLPRMSKERAEALVYAEVPYVFRQTDRDTSRWIRSTESTNPGLTHYRWYDLLSLVEAVFAEAGIELEPLPVPAFETRYLDSGGAVRTLRRVWRPHILGFGSYTSGPYSASNLTLPAWTGRELVEHVLRLFPWRVRARYEPFPSLGIRAAFVTDSWAPAAEDDLSGREGAGGVTRRGTPGQSRDYGVRHAGALRAATPEIRQYRLFPPTPDGIVTTGLIPVPPPPVASLALSRWAFEPTPGARPDDEPRPLAREVVDTGFTLPMLAHYPGDALALPSYEHAPDLTTHPDYNERVTYGVPVVTGDWDAVYLAALVPRARDFTLLHAREALTPVPEGAEAVFSETWAASWFRLRDLSVRPLEIAEGTFHLTGAEAFEVGVPASGVRLQVEGEDGAGAEDVWMVDASRRDLDTGAATLRLARPADGEAPAPEAPARTGVPLGLRARYERTASSTTGNFIASVLLVTWNPPPLVQAAVRYYHLQVRRVFVGVDGVPVPEPWGEPILAHGPAWIITQPDHGRIYEMRARAVGLDGENGAWSDVLSIETTNEAAGW